MSTNPEVQNPLAHLGGAPIAHPGASSGTQVESSRAIGEVQAAVVMAKKFPRDQKKAMDAILVACARKTLAEVAVYSYVKGGSHVTGPSIRLAEAIVQAWGNIQTGVIEVDQRNGVSTCLAYAWDLESNTRQEVEFKVRHERYSKKKGIEQLSEARDIYEMVANQGARRRRACILGLIPGDIVDAAKAQCEQTLLASADTGPEAIKRMVEKFMEHNVTREMLEKRIARNLETITPAQIIQLRTIYTSLKEGMSSIETWFEVPQAAQPEGTTQTEKLKNSMKAEQKPAGEPAP